MTALAAKITAPAREQIADSIVARLEQEESRLREQFAREPVSHFVIDNLLDESLARDIYEAYPDAEQMKFKDTLRERKYVAAQMNHYHPLLEEILYAFQDPRVLAVVSRITGLKELHADPHLYAGGISLMNKNCFLNPHIDNSHDKDRAQYRVLNLLYYVTPGWKTENGGNLELWPQGVRGRPQEIPSLFNRLVCMVTHTKSFHSVNYVQVNASRCCVSNYFFSPLSPMKNDYFHVTTFRGRPEEPFKRIALYLDGHLRMGLRRIKRSGVFRLTHVYRREA